MPKNRLHKEDYVNGILNGNRLILSRAITLIESSRSDDNELAEEVLNSVISNNLNSIRIGITGVPGVGKSTFIESFGCFLTSKKKKTAVLSVDPSSQISGGSILGDKTRMERLSKDPLAFIRPSASGNTLGGVGPKTYEIIRLCEAAGYEVILIETVGVGQSETIVKDMVDFFLLLMITGAGDDLQGIKRGIMEMADLIAITKADGDNIKNAEHAKTELQSALHFFPPKENLWNPKAITCSALNQSNIDSVWEIITEFKDSMKTNGWMKENRSNQSIKWMHKTIQHNLHSSFYTHQSIKDTISEVEQQVKGGQLNAISASKKLLKLFHS